MFLRVFAALCLFSVVLPAGGVQLWSRNGDQITLTIEHPAAIKASLDHIAFAQPSGPCSEEFADALVADFASSGKVVIDRLHLKNLMAEHKVNVSGAVEGKTAAKIGKLIGTGSLVFVKVHECKAYHVREPNHNIDIKGNISKEEVPTTRGSLKASVQIIDLTTGVMVAARMIDAKVSVQMRQGASMKERFLSTAMSLRGVKDIDSGDYPPDDQAFSALHIEAVKQVHRSLLPWSETKKLIFYNDRECGLNAAYVALQGGDYEAAAREALASVQKCESTPGIKPIQLARAHFNRGMTLYLNEDYLNAMASFGNAARLDTTNKAWGETMQECNKAWAAAQVDNVGKKKSGTAPEIAQTKQPLKPVNAPSVEERLAKLDELRKKKMISEEEYAKKRKEILDDI